MRKGWIIVGVALVAVGFGWASGFFHGFAQEFRERNPNGLERGTIRGNSNLPAGGPPQNLGSGECATCGVKQMNGKRLNLKVCQDDPQRTVIYRVGTLVVQNASHTHALGCSPNSRLGGGH